MKNILKLTGVSVLAIMATANANAAGYTCEELIEYTSCNAGYYLNDGGDACPSGYTHYPNGVCIEEADMRVADFATKAECEAAWEGGRGTDYKWYTGPVCVSGGESGYSVEISAANENAGKTCNECPAGSICSGGTAGATACPAGSYCAKAGLSTVSGQCSKGTYSVGGAVSCSTCPATNLTDKDGATVVATTLTTGATTPSACVVGEEHYFTDTKGTYHFKSDCGLTPWKITVSTQEECESLGEGWQWDGYSECHNYNDSVALAPTTEEECLSEIEVQIDGEIEWVDGKCVCSTYWVIYPDSEMNCF